MKSFLDLLQEKSFVEFLTELKNSSNFTMTQQDIVNRYNFEVCRGAAPRWWKPKNRAQSATAQVTYRPIKKVVEYLNSLLEKDFEEDSAIAAPELQYELGVCGFDRFTLKALEFAEGFNRLEWVDESGDFHFIVSHTDENGRACYSATEFVKAFEAIHAAEIKAAKAASKKAEREAKAAKIKATKAALGKVSTDTLKAIVAA